MTLPKAKQERLDVLKRFDSQVRALEQRIATVRLESDAIFSDIQNGMFDRARTEHMASRMHALLTEADQAEAEIAEIDRFIKRATETYTRDFPQFGRGQLK